MCLFLTLLHVAFYVYTVWALCKGRFGHIVIEIIAIIYCIALFVLSVIGLGASIYAFFSFCLDLDGSLGDLACYIFSPIPFIICGKLV